MSEGILSRIQPQLNWLKESGIQLADGPDEGGVCAWIDEQTGRESYLYSEITGYFMTLAAHIARYAPDDGWIDRAERAAGWIDRVAMTDSGAVLTRKYTDAAQGRDDPYSFDEGLSIFFDCAMVGFGLVNTYEATENQRWLHCADTIGRFCLKAFESPDGRDRFAAYDTRRAQSLAAADRWSQHFGSFELKIAMFFDSLARHTGNGAYRDFNARVLDDTLPLQQDSGRFGTNLAGTVTHLHPHNYTIEALLYLAGRHSREDLLDRARRAIDFAFDKCLSPDGQIVQAWSETEELAIPGLRSDVLAQSLRSYHAAKLLDPDARWPWEERVPALEQLMESFTLPSGGTSYGEDEYGTRSSHANAWCHFFNTEMRLLRAVGGTASPWDPRQIILT